MRMFEQVDIYKNLGKTKSMKFSPGFIWDHLGKDYYKRRVTGKSTTFG